MSRVLVVTADVLRPQMAGPAMRAWHMAQHLSTDNEVRLVTTSPYCEVQAQGFSAYAVGPEGLAEGEQWCDVMVLQGYVTYHHPTLARSEKVIVFDVYDPLHLETLALTTGYMSPGRNDHVRLSIDLLNRQLGRADYLLCASSRQRDLFIGQLCALGRVNPYTYDSDPTLRSLIDIVPFGLPDSPPEHPRAALRGVYPGIGPHDDVLIWAGGVYDWFDPLTLIRAVAGVAQARPTVRLFFMGMRHPNPDVPEMQVAVDARALAAELGLEGKHVFFNDGWVDYADRQNFLLEADLGVSMHYDSAETRFSFRTRQLDYLWAALPVVATEGDSFAELITTEGLGLIVPPRDPEALQAALLELLSDRPRADACRERAAAVRPRFAWSTVLEPLAEFCRHPRRAPDLSAGFLPVLPGEISGPPEPGTAAAPPVRPHEEPAGVQAEAQLPPVAPKTPLEVARHHYRQGGWAQVARQAASKAARVARRPHDGSAP